VTAPNHFQSSAELLQSPLVLVGQLDPVIPSLVPFLEQEGYTVIHQHQDLALQIRQTSPHLLITTFSENLVLPTNSPPCLILLPREEPEKVTQALAAGATDYLVLPIHWPLLRRRLSALVAKDPETQTKNTPSSLQRLTQAVYACHDLKALFSTSVTEIAHFLESEQVSLVQYMRQKDVWIPITTYQRRVDTLVDLGVLSRHRETAQRLQNLEVVYIPDPESSRSRTWILIPLYNEQKILWGSLVVLSESPLSLETALGVGECLGTRIDQVTKVQTLQQNYQDLQTRMQERIAQLRAQVKELNRRKGVKNQLLLNFSQDLRSPLSKIKMAIQMLGQPSKTPSAHTSRMARLDKYLQILQNECNAAIELINTLPDKIKQELGSAAPCALDPREWILRVSEAFQEQIPPHTLHLDLPVTLPSLSADPFTLDQILMSVLHYTWKLNSGVATGAIFVGVEQTASSLLIKISNKSIEIPSHEIPFLFDRFQVTPEDDFLDLALVRQEIELLGGSITLNSQYGQTQFILCFPLTLETATLPVTVSQSLYATPQSQSSS
jgi:signal transduction histidine kinase